MNPTRRNFLKAIGTAAIATPVVMIGAKAEAGEPKTHWEEDTATFLLTAEEEAELNNVPRRFMNDTEWVRLPGGGVAAVERNGS